MKSVLIVGAGGFGRELLAWCGQDPACGREWTVRGFLDDNLKVLEGRDMPVGVVGTVADYQPQAGEELLCAIGLPVVKRRVVETLKSRGAAFRRFVHPSVVMGRNVRLGEGAVLCPGVILTSDITVGDFVMFNCGASAGHDVKVGRYTTVSGHCDLTGFVQVGEEVFFGSGARVIPGKRVGDKAVVGAGSVVIMNVSPGSTVMGVPARSLSGV
jgi:sugar O-acyltransferase (sialic acid O-acetyltransferase NeuD family)